MSIITAEGGKGGGDGDPLLAKFVGDYNPMLARISENILSGSPFVPTYGTLPV